MSEPSNVEPSVPAAPGPESHEVHVDLAGFLPEGTTLAPSDVVDDPWDTGAPEPEIPAWALDPEPATPAATVVDHPVPGPSAAPADVPAPAAPRPSAVDLGQLGRVEDELAAVDDALVALDAGDPARSPLLVELLGL